MGEVGGKTVGALVDGSLAILQKQKNTAVKAMLAKDAAAKTVFTGGCERTPVVLSPHIQFMTRTYRSASRGRVIVMCAPADSGKTRAAEFLLHGDYPFRPERSLMISAAAMKNFEEEFSEKLGVSNVNSLAQFILSALAKGSTLPASASASEIATKSVDWIENLAFCSIDEKEPFDETNEIKILGQNTIAGEAFHSMPVLVIDSFNEGTEENELFVKKLLHEASQYGVVVFILTTKETWATTLVGLNGGSKIKPLYGNVDNEDYQISRAFVGIPQWNTLPWPVATLRELIKEICRKLNLDPVKVVPDGTTMLPVEALDNVYDLAASA